MLEEQLEQAEPPDELRKSPPDALPLLKPKAESSFCSLELPHSGQQDASWDIFLAKNSNFFSQSVHLYS